MVKLFENEEFSQSNFMIYVVRDSCHNVTDLKMTVYKDTGLSISSISGLYSKEAIKIAKSLIWEDNFKKKIGLDSRTPGQTGLDQMQRIKGCCLR